MTPERLYTLKELSELTGKPEYFLRDLIRRGYLNCHQNCDGGRIHVTASQWQAYLEGTETTGAGSTDPSRGPRARGSQRVHRTSRRTKGSTFNGRNRKDPEAYTDLELV